MGSVGSPVSCFSFAPHPQAAAIHDGFLVSQGERGEKGQRGAMGERGPSGVVGDTGLPGEKGEAGDDVSATFSSPPSTLDLLSLSPCPPAVQGSTGPPGFAGMKGRQGEKVTCLSNGEQVMQKHTLTSLLCPPREIEALRAQKVLMGLQDKR